MAEKKVFLKREIEKIMLFNLIILKPFYNTLLSNQAFVIYDYSNTSDHFTGACMHVRNFLPLQKLLKNFI